MCGGRLEQIARNVIATLWAAERVAIHDISFDLAGRLSARRFLRPRKYPTQRQAAQDFFLASISMMRSTSSPIAPR
jgi:hypothetical protein